MPTVYSTGPIANIPSGREQIVVGLLNNEFDEDARVRINVFDVFGRKRVVANRTVRLPGLYGRDVVFQVGSLALRVYEVQIIVTGAEENVMVSAWKTISSPDGKVSDPDKRVLHSEMVARFLPFIPVVPLPPIGTETAT